MLTRLIETGLRAGAHARLIEASGFFDAEWYARHYPEAGPPGQALSHFLKTGARQGNDPGPGFSTRAYLADNPDVAGSGVNPLVHYLRFGRREGRIARDRQGRPSGAAQEHGLGDAALARVRAAFDPEFYAATNPDMLPGEDAFDHFMGPGWRQRRDPAPWFSTEHYLRSHADIAGRGENPFAHYVLSGCREGRSIAASTRALHGDTAAAERLRLAALVMVKNEADIIRAFAGHVLALFDEVVIVDHGSTDGTAEFLSALAVEHGRVSVLRLEEPSYIQSVTMTHLVRDLPVLREAGWVFPLDADEFLPFPDRAAFEAALAPFHRCPVIGMRWRNLIPGRYWDTAVEPGEAAGVLVPPNASPFRKVAFQPARLAIDRMVVAQGNHAILETVNGIEVPAFEADFPLLHLPVRSADQILLKLDQGVRAYRRMGGRRDGGQGTHWDQMRQALGGGAPGRGLLNALALDYSEPKDRLAPVDDAALLAAGFRRDRFAPASLAEDALPPLDAPALAEMLMRLEAEEAPVPPAEDCVAATRLRIDGDRIVRADGGAEYARLEDGDLPAGVPGVSEALAKLLRGSYQDIGDLMPDDWAGHVPFMLGLAQMIRPRRYVEIGTLWGTSFFALTQAVSAVDADCEAVAVSAWAVEPERQAEFANVHETFQFVARKYARMIGTLRMAAGTALHRFEDGSIDLLHLDGFSDDEGIARTWEDWRPKLSDRGVVLVHDIHAHGPNFGVWRFWDELSAGFPTFEFRHDRGLGVAVVGKAAPPGLKALAKAFGEDPSLRTLMQEHFERMGRASAEMFSRRYDMAQAEMRTAAEGAQTEEIGRLRQELATVTAEADGLRALVRQGVRRAG